VANDRSAPGGKRGDLVTYSAIDRSPQSGTGAAREWVGAKGASPTSVRINALKDTAERIRSTLKKHSEEHAEARHVLSQAVVIPPQRSAQNAPGPSCLLHILSHGGSEDCQCVVRAVHLSGDWVCVTQIPYCVWRSRAAPHLEKHSPSKADRATTEVPLADSSTRILNVSSANAF
jgi:hypothetical protein